ncbi:hypothetical protein ZTR_10061 [Talaromyces verruculosus]|nr:hypothetical protein ZTR_10061 [Talaromyces verruculosus]
MKKDMKMQAIEWWEWDWEYAYEPEVMKEAATKRNTLYALSHLASFKTKPSASSLNSPSRNKTESTTSTWAHIPKSFSNSRRTKSSGPKTPKYFLYADPIERGYYPVFQSLDAPGFLEGSGIIFVTVVHDQSYRVEAQTDDVPDPIAFMYPRWSLEPWAYGSYSNWPYGVTLEMHQNLRANVGRLYFAGEATSAEYVTARNYFSSWLADGMIDGRVDGASRHEAIPR